MLSKTTTRSARSKDRILSFFVDVLECILPISIEALHLFLGGLSGLRPPVRMHTRMGEQPTIEKDGTFQALPEFLGPCCVDDLRTLASRRAKPLTDHRIRLTGILATNWTQGIIREIMVSAEHVQSVAKYLLQTHQCDCHALQIILVGIYDARRIKIVTKQDDVIEGREVFLRDDVFQKIKIFVNIRDNK